MPYNLYINGSLVDRGATNSELVRLTPYRRGGYPELSVRKKGFVLANLPDAWDYASVRLDRVDPITSAVTTIFAGFTTRALLHYVDGVGWCREWQCLGLRAWADYFPVTDSVTSTDVSQFNLPTTDPNCILSRTGRNIGQIAADVLEMPTNKANLIKAGVGNYTSATGSGATATLTVSNAGVIINAVIDNGGSGYTVAPTILVVGGGGSNGAITATVSGGVVTHLTIANGGTGYTSAPTLIFSTLPAVTLTDLAALTIIPPYRVSVQGERLLQSLEGVVTNAHPNHLLHVDAAGYIRFLDQRTFAATTLTMDGDDPRVGKPSLSIDWNSCYSQVEIRGNTMARAITVQTQPWSGSTATDGGLQEDFAHDGLSSDQAKLAFVPSDYVVPGSPTGVATALASTSGGKVVGISVGYGGYGYTSAPSVVITGNGTGATATATISGGVVSGVTVTSQGSGYTQVPSVLIGSPGGAGQTDIGTCTCPDTQHVTVTSANPGVTWPANYWDQTETGRQGVVIVRSDSVTDITQTFTARVVSNTALTAGGTSTLTLDTPLPQTSYNSYQLYGTGGGASIVYRRYKVTNSAYASALMNYFPYPMALVNSTGTAATLTSAPTGTICYSASGQPPYTQSPMGFVADPEAGTITFYRPTALVFGGGTVVTPPNNVIAFLAVDVGVLQAFAPSSSTYAGTAYTQFGIEQTKVVTIREWTDYSNDANMALYASELLDSVKDVFIEGQVPYYGELPWALTFGSALNIAGNGYTTGFESAAVPIVQCDVDFHEDAQGATSFVTTLHISNRRELISSEIFLRPSITGQPLGAEEFAGNQIVLGSDEHGQGGARGSESESEPEANGESGAEGFGGMGGGWGGSPWSSPAAGSSSPSPTPASQSTPEPDSDAADEIGEAMLNHGQSKPGFDPSEDSHPSEHPEIENRHGDDEGSGE